MRTMKERLMQKAKANKCDYHVLKVEKSQPYKDSIDAGRMASQITDALIQKEIPAKYIRPAAISVIETMIQSYECNKLIIRTDAELRPILGINYKKFMLRVIHLIESQ